MQANEDVERIARALYEEFGRATDAFRTHDSPPWLQLSDSLKNTYCHVAQRLLHRDVIRVGHRPSVDQPMEGQTRIEDTDTGGVVRFEDG